MNIERLKDSPILLDLLEWIESLEDIGLHTVVHKAVYGEIVLGYVITGTKNEKDLLNNENTKLEFVGMTFEDDLNEIS